MEVDHEAAIRAVEEWNAAKQTRRGSEIRRAVFDLFRACGWNTREAKKYVDGKTLNSAVSRLNLSRLIKRRRFRTILAEAKNNEGITNAYQLAERFYIARSTIRESSISKELKEIFAQRRQKARHEKGLESPESKREKQVQRCVTELDSLKRRKGKKAEKRRLVLTLFRLCGYNSKEIKRHINAPRLYKLVFDLRLSGKIRRMKNNAIISKAKGDPRITTYRQLAAKFGVSSDTIRKAIPGVSRIFEVNKAKMKGTWAPNAKISPEQRGESVDALRAIDASDKLKILLRTPRKEKNERKKLLLLELCTACNWDLEQMQRYIPAKSLSNLMTRFGLNKLRQSKRAEILKELILNAARKREDINSITAATLRLGFEKKTFNKFGIIGELNIIFAEKNEERRKKKITEREEAIINSYGNIAEAGRQLGGKKFHTKKLEKMEVNVQRAVNIGLKKLKNDLMFVLKMTEYNLPETAKIWGIHQNSLMSLIKRFNISKETIEKYHAPFAVVPAGKIVDHYEFPIPEGKIKLNNWNWYINQRLRQARETILHARTHPDKGGSRERLKTAINGLERIRRLDARIRKRFNLPRREVGIIRIPRDNRKPPTRWDTLKMKKPSLAHIRRK